MMEAFDLHGLVDGNSVAPSSTITFDVGVQSPNPAFQSWKAKDRKLLSVIFVTLSEEAMAEVVDCRDSRSAWLGLEAVFAHSSTSRVNQLRAELLNLRRDSQSVANFGRAFKSLCSQLSSIGRPIEENDKCHWFLRSLGPQFIGFSDTRMAMSHILTFRDLVHQAIQYEIMLRAMEASAAPEAAFYSNDRAPGNNSGGNSRGGRPPHGGGNQGSGNQGGNGRSYSNRGNSGRRGRNSSGGNGGLSGGQPGGHHTYIPRC